MLAHVSPDLGCAAESASTLFFAERVASVQLGAAAPNRGGEAGPTQGVPPMDMLKRVRQMYERAEERHQVGIPSMGTKVYQCIPVLPFGHVAVVRATGCGGVRHRFR